jgi:hypothetical protein
VAATQPTDSGIRDESGDDDGDDEVASGIRDDGGDGDDEIASGIRGDGDGEIASGMSRERIGVAKSEC